MSEPEEEGPWLTGWVSCIHCDYEWVAVRPVVCCEPMECPRCGRFGGYAKVGEGLGKVETNAS